MNKRAFVTFVMLNDAYVPGAAVFAYALKRQSCQSDAVCLIGEGVSETARKTLEIVYDRVIRVEEIFIPHQRRHERQDRPFLFTRFQSLRLGSDGDLGCEYDDIVVADCDVLPLVRYDTLFDIAAPAGIINERKEHCVESEDGVYVMGESVEKDGTWLWHKIYQDIPMGARIPKAITDRVREDSANMGVNAALYRFTPSMAMYEDINRDIRSEKTQADISRYAWPEMQYITAYLSGKWHNLDLRFASFNGYPRIDVLYGIHYAGLKPWRRTHRSIEHFSRYEDYQLWQAVFRAMVKQTPLMCENPAFLKLNAWAEKLSRNGETAFKRPHLDHVKHLF